jgi:2,3-bisphosphoglycerate-dependent phosphoglycerate mutase
MQFYFIRHGQSENNLLLDLTGAEKGRSEDPPLSSKGQRQAEILAEFLKQTNPAAAKSHDEQNLAGFGITHLYCSLMVRAVATGAIIAPALGLPLVAWQDLHERGGIYLDDAPTGARVGQPGKNRAYFERNFPMLVLPKSLGEAGWWNRGYEEWAETRNRAERFYRELMQRHGSTADRVAVISHGDFYTALLRVIFKIERDDCWFHLNNAAITRIDFDERGITVAYMNRVDYLPRELVT